MDPLTVNQLLIWVRMLITRNDTTESLKETISRLMQIGFRQRS
jgi:hypothetical protein